METINTRNVTNQLKLIILILHVLFHVLFQSAWSSLGLDYRISDLTCDTFNTPYLTHWNIEFRICVRRCTLRARCHAVNYWRVRQKCEFFDTDVYQVPFPNTRACVYVKRTDMITSQEFMDGCQICGINQICLPDTIECKYRECEVLSIPNAEVIGNVVDANAVVRIIPNAGYTLDDASYKATCGKLDGQWTVPTIEKIDCGDPPIVANASISSGLTEYETVRTYECAYGYDVINVSIDMTVTCTANTSWSPVLFKCIEKTCESTWVKMDQSCYLYRPVSQLRTAAMTFCAGFSAHLVTMETAAEISELKAALIDRWGTSSNWWIGIDDIANEGNWVYTHTNLPIEASDWGDGEPSNSNGQEHCAVIGYGHQAWADVVCHSTRKVICEKSTQVYVAP